MSKKDKAILTLKLLLPLLPAGAMVFGNQTNTKFMTNMTIVLVWSIVFVLISWRDYVGKRGPKVQEPDHENLAGKELAFTYPRSLAKFLFSVYFNPATIRVKTWNFILLIAYLFFLVSIGYMLEHTIIWLCLLSSIFIASVVVSLTGYVKAYRKTVNMNVVTIVNRKGLIASVPHLSNQKGKNIDYIYVSHVSWAEVERILFYQTHIEVTFASTHKLFLFADKNEKISQMKAFFAHFYNQKQGGDLLCTNNYRQQFLHIVSETAGIVCQDCNSFKLGESYIAPIPSVPNDFTWPTNHRLPLALIAQINCADLPSTLNDLPSNGILYFFYEMKEMLLNEKGNKGCARVMYSSTPVDQLHFHKDNKSLNPHFFLRPRKLQFQAEDSFPTFHDAGRKDEIFADSNEETYNYAKWHYQNVFKKAQKKANTIGNIMGEPKINRDKLLNDDGEDLVLLLQLTLDKTDFLGYYQDTPAQKGKDYYEAWPELPCQLFYFVPREDLRNLNFSNIRFACRSLNVENISFDQLDLTTLNL